MADAWKTHVEKGRKEPNHVLLNAFRACDSAEATSADVRLVHLLVRDGILPVIDKSAEMTAVLDKMTSTAVFYRTDVGRRALVDVIVDAQCNEAMMHNVIRHVAENMKSTTCGRNAADVLWRLWRMVEKDENGLRELYETDCLQYIIRKAIHCRPEVASTLRRLMTDTFGGHKDLRAVDSLLYRTTLPILWHAFESPNNDTQLNAGKFLFAFFPLRNARDGPDTVAFRTDLRRQLDIVTTLCKSDDQRIRLAAVTAVFNILASLWDVLPADWMRMIITHVLTEARVSDVAHPVRLAVVEGVHNLLTKCVQSRAPIGKVLPHVCQLGIADPNEKVRLATVNLVASYAKLVKKARFYELLPVPRALKQLTVETSTETRKKIVNLLLPSFVPTTQKGEDDIAHRLTTQVKFNNSAMRVFYRYAVSQVEKKETLVGHVQILIRLARLHLNAMEKGEESGLSVLDIATLIDVACILLTGLNDFMGTPTQTKTRARIFRGVAVLGEENSELAARHPPLHEALLCLSSMLPEKENMPMCRMVMEELAKKTPSSAVISAGARWRLDEILDIVQLSLTTKTPRPKNAITVGNALQHLDVILRNSQTQERLVGPESHRIMPLTEALAKFHKSFLKEYPSNDGAIPIEDILKAMKTCYTLSLLAVSHVEDITDKYIAMLSSVTNWLIRDMWPLTAANKNSIITSGNILTAFAQSIQMLTDAVEHSPLDYGNEEVGKLVDAVLNVANVVLNENHTMSTMMRNVCRAQFLSLSTLTMKLLTTLFNALVGVLIDESIAAERSIVANDDSTHVFDRLRLCAEIIANGVVNNAKLRDPDENGNPRQSIELHAAADDSDVDEEVENQPPKVAVNALTLCVNGFVQMLRIRETHSISTTIPSMCRASVSSCLPLDGSMEALLDVAIDHLKADIEGSDTCEDASDNAFQCHSFVYQFAKRIVALSDTVRTVMIGLLRPRIQSASTTSQVGSIMQITQIMHKWGAVTNAQYAELKRAIGGRARNLNDDSDANKQLIELINA